MDESIPAAIAANPHGIQTALETIEIGATENPRYSVIWLHGLGADGNDFVPVVPQLELPPEAAVRFVFPHAPVIPVTVNGGMSMRAWYDIESIAFDREHDRDGIRRSSDMVRGLIEAEAARGVPPGRIVLAGFSQGGALALHVGLRYPERLAGLISLSSYLLFADQLVAQRSAANEGLPIFLGHGTLDPVVPFRMGRASAEVLGSLGYALTWQSYRMPHSVCMEEIQDISRWMRDVMK